MVYACENAYLWIYLSSRVETPKNEEEASRTPSSHEILSSLTSSPRCYMDTLFGVCTTGHSGVHTVDIQVKGLGIVGPQYKLKDVKIDINQLNAFNQILHFIVCQILVPRSATYSTCTKADSDMMFWAIQNQSINIAEVMIERMKFASAQVWDKKSKLNVSLPYAHLLTKRKMGQAIRSRNLKKSGFSLVGGTNISCKGSVDTTINGVDTMVQNKGRNVKKSSSSVDTSPGQVDTGPSQVDTRDLS
ncbi:hypothetical protein Taro_029395 [Colocasia esculenta]|uniref:Uncharacterized protein n=1 Tax=Colocasia esculenta TaxID=4460 RepID=A0A843VT48_COLES|nr:hypothetical protein [Colocasia esculenta]